MKGSDTMFKFFTKKKNGENIGRKMKSRTQLKNGEKTRRSINENGEEVYYFNSRDIIDILLHL
ncbi:hypothetical protein SLEP1_g57562 [Rubroshorea leprosula]|uniref:Uncharacterized protein n=1 Tax=Rubroshorea leprosula TaxID=152421 RepID=A0AAV5MN03_9ROSI|nr:hypothetical protein SLEP1_g57562 [Rubroshorea leprosula]